MKGRRVEPAAILEHYPPAVVGLANATRDLVKAVAPDVEEAGRPGWNLVGYRRRGYFAFVAPMDDHVRLGFEHGVLLPDPAGLLAGAGKQVRYVVLRTVADLENPAVVRLLEAAVALDELRGR